jgi:MerR family transcriptional regulator, light-induced transcriptional regulator
LSGVAVDTVRNWERRYGLVVAVRGRGGQRLYSDADVENLRALQGLVREGLSAGEAHHVLARRLSRMSPAGVREASRRVRAEVAATHRRAAVAQAETVRVYTVLAESADGAFGARLRTLADQARRREQRTSALARAAAARLDALAG